VSDFVGTASTDSVYLYALFGAADRTTDSTGGFEKFAVVCNVTPIPELSALFPTVGLMAAFCSTNGIASSPPSSNRGIMRVS
jgi:hypothetical protein